MRGCEGAMPNESLLLTFCNQEGSPYHSLCLADPAGQRMSWINLDSIMMECGANFGGVCGAFCSGEMAAICIQSSKAVLARLDTATGKLCDHVPLEGCRDPHSMVFHEGYVYIVSTGTNEIYRVRCDGQSFGEQQVYWRYPGARYDHDDVHLNSIAVFND